MIEDEILVEFNKAKVSKLWRLIASIFIALLVSLVVVFVVVLILNKPPNGFVPNTSLEIRPGATVRDITEQLEDSGVIKSSTLLYFLLAFLYEPTDIKASKYLFTEPISTYQVAQRLVVGDFSNNLVRFTHFEGERVTSIASRASQVLDNFDAEYFTQIAIPYEGKLFPDTYFIPKDFTADQLLALMLETFEVAMIELDSELVNSDLSLDEIIVLASIIEREANSPESMRMVSGILQNRLAINMPLQADASIEYVLDKPLAELTPDDLKIESPYNTYLNLGLPPTAIGNPGLTAIKAVLSPLPSDYYFYITDETGTFYYARTYDEHKLNIDKYLR